MVTQDDSEHVQYKREKKKKESKANNEIRRKRKTEQESETKRAKTKTKISLAESQPLLGKPLGESLDRQRREKEEKRLCSKSRNGFPHLEITG